MDDYYGIKCSLIDFLNFGSGLRQVNLEEVTKDSLTQKLKEAFPQVVIQYLGIQSDPKGICLTYTVINTNIEDTVNLDLQNAPTWV